MTDKMNVTANGPVHEHFFCSYFFCDCRSYSHSTYSIRLGVPLPFPFVINQKLIALQSNALTSKPEKLHSQPKKNDNLILKHWAQAYEVGQSQGATKYINYRLTNWKFRSLYEIEYKSLLVYHLLAAHNFSFPFSSIEWQRTAEKSIERAPGAIAIATE